MRSATLPSFAPGGLSLVARAPSASEVKTPLGSGVCVCSGVLAGGGAVTLSGALACSRVAGSVSAGPSCRIGRVLLASSPLLIRVFSETVASSVAA